MRHLCFYKSHIILLDESKKSYLFFWRSHSLLELEEHANDMPHTGCLIIRRDTQQWECKKVKVTVTVMICICKVFHGILAHLAKLRSRKKESFLKVSESWLFVEGEECFGWWAGLWRRWERTNTSFVNHPQYPACVWLLDRAAVSRVKNWPA